MYVYTVYPRTYMLYAKKKNSSLPCMQLVLGKIASNRFVYHCLKKFQQDGIKKVYFEKKGTQISWTSTSTVLYSNINKQWYLLIYIKY